MASDRALVFPGLVPLTEPALAAVLDRRDDHLEFAARICRFHPDGIDRDEGSTGLPSTVHEALLAVAVVRRLEQEAGRWTAYGGLSAGCLPALLAAGAITEETCFRLIWEINSRQIAANRLHRSGSTLVFLASSRGDAHQLIEALRRYEKSAWLSVDLGGGLGAVSVRSTEPEVLGPLFHKFGVSVMETVDRAEHCPYAVPEPQEFARILRDVEFCTPNAAVVSPLTGKQVDNTPDALRRMLLEQWFDTASLPRLVEGLCGVDGVRGVDLVAPAKSVYVPCMRGLLQDRAEHRFLRLPG
ncbi:hypothetical protein [Streptomyces natalensis]|uniref:Malonyl-CoA:ACP transacylase (MAT) domain-containing protein n=1 Tax=Streptomyces natalensis ATCC 27448 TaxID=1240678 RepID=A0A0D7CTH8_9ACTN|nr:hypothetical protein [Streptomyces natalensis]KIZ19538.1 hypothetical protein SNA_03260 [Streptomyces natalensis ATCC 27448]